MHTHLRHGRTSLLAGIALGIFLVPPASSRAVPRFFGAAIGLQFSCDRTERALKSVVHVQGGQGSLCPGWAPTCDPEKTYGLDIVWLPPLVAGKPFVAEGGQWVMVNNGNPTISVDPETTALGGQATFRPGKWVVLSGTGPMVHIDLTDGTIIKSCPVSWTVAGQQRATAPPSPRGQRWLLNRAIQLQAAARAQATPLRTDEAAAPPLWVAVTPCASQTTCIGPPGSGRADLLVRALPLSGGRLTPAYVPLTAAGIDVWSRWIGEGDEEARSWVITDATTDPNRPGFLDLIGYEPPGQATAPDEIEADVEALDAPFVGFDPELTSIVAEVGPSPPSAQWLTSPSFPGFRFQAVLAGKSLVQATACPAQAICLAKLASGAPEVVARILPKQANGKRWPVLGKFASQRAEVWIEQTRTRQVRYYELIARAAGDPELAGIVDRVGFAP